MIKDSGERREFDTGAVRDIQEGKGRCDLLPLGTVADYMESQGLDYRVIRHIHNFQESGNIFYLQRALAAFNLEYGWSDLTMLLEVSKHFEEGECNWQKGIPTHCYINSAVRHYLKWLRGDDDEPHDRAFVWNILCCVWTCENKPELNDYKTKDKTEENK